FVPWIHLRLLEQLIHRLRWESNGWQAVFRAVAEENIGEAGGDDDAEAVVKQSPDRVLAGRAGAKVVACQKDGSVGKSWFIQHEIRIDGTLTAIHAQRALVKITPVVEKKVSE